MACSAREPASLSAISRLHAAKFPMVSLRVRCLTACASLKANIRNSAEPARFVSVYEEAFSAAFA
jgi:hypothetical protein